MQEDKNLEKLVDNLMKYDRLQKPSQDFTSSVMEHIESLKTSKTTIVYKPLISKPAWAVIGVCVLVIAGFAVFGTSTSQSTWLPQVNYDALVHNNLTNTLSGFKFSSTTMYAVVLLALMLCIQVPLLKNYMDRQLT